MNEPNPYASPVAVAEPHSAAGNLECFGELVRGWEKLRLQFNGILFLPGVGVIVLWVGRTELTLPTAVIMAAPIAIGANVAFFLGPLAELYIRGLFRAGYPIGIGRRLIFIAGLMVSAGVFLIATFLGLAAGNA